MAPMPAALRENEGKTSRGNPSGGGDHALPTPPVHLGFSPRQAASGFRGRSRSLISAPAVLLSSAPDGHPRSLSFTRSLALSLSLSLSRSPSPPAPTSSPPLSHWKFPLHRRQASAVSNARSFFSPFFAAATLFSQPVFLSFPLYHNLSLSLSLAFSSQVVSLSDDFD